MKPEEDPDVQLMLAVQRGDTEAFNTLFRRYIGQVVGFALSFVGSRARAEELAQDAFMQVFRTRDRYEPRARFTTWLYRIVTNLCLSEVRRAEHRSVVHPDDRAEEEGDAELAVIADPETRSGEDDLLSQERVERVQEVLGLLPAQQRAALLLARVEGQSYAEVARSLGCSVSAVKSLIHRATVTLREQLGATS